MILFEVCPVCKVKKVAGIHTKVCVRKRPKDWLNYWLLQAVASRDRMGRMEMVDALRGRKGV